MQIVTYRGIINL